MKAHASIGLAALLLAVAYGELLVRIQKCIVKVHDPTTIATNMSCTVKPLDRSTTALKLTANILRKIYSMTLNAQLFKRAEINYRPFLVNITENYCDYFSKRRGGWYLRMVGPLVIPYSNLNHSCPYFGLVEVKDLAVKTVNLPAMWPEGHYRLDLLISDGKPVVAIQVFVELKPVTVGQ